MPRDSLSVTETRCAWYLKQHDSLLLGGGLSTRARRRSLRLVSRFPAIGQQGGEGGRARCQGGVGSGGAVVFVVQLAGDGLDGDSW